MKFVLLINLRLLLLANSFLQNIAEHENFSANKYGYIFGIFIFISRETVYKLSWVEHHYENMPIQIYWNFFPPKNENFQIKILIFFNISAQNIDCGYSLEPRGGSNEYPQSMFLSRNKKNNVYPCQPQFYYIKVGLRGSKLYSYVLVMW